MTDALGTIRIVLSEVMQEDVGPLSPETDIATDLDLDSILFVQFLLVLEDRVPGLEFNQETLAEMAFDTIGSLVEHIDSVATVAAE